MSALSWLRSPVGTSSLSKITSSVKGNDVLSHMATKARALHARDMAINAYKRSAQRGIINKPTMKRLIGEAKRKTMPPGNFVQRQIHHVAEDASHPIRNLKESLLNIFYKYDPHSKTMAGKSRLYATGSAALAVGFPAWMISDVVKDKDLSKGNKVGKSIAYAAIPPMTVSPSWVPSILAYSMADKAFRKKPDALA